MRIVSRYITGLGKEAETMSTVIERRGRGLCVKLSTRRCRREAWGNEVISNTRDDTINVAVATSGEHFLLCLNCIMALVMHCSRNRDNWRN